MFGTLLSFLKSNWTTVIVAALCLMIGSVITFFVMRSTRNEALNQDKNRSRFSKIAIIVLFSIMTLFALFSFFGNKYGYSISTGIVYIFALMIFLLISDSVETFSLGNLLTLSKKVKEKEKEVDKLSSENNQLRTQIVSIATASISNNNHNQVIIDLSKALKGVNIESAVEGDREKIEINQEAADNNEALSHSEKRYFSGYNRNLFVRITEKKAIEKFAVINGIDFSSIQTNAKFSEQFTYGNPIMEDRLVYDAYLKRPLDELFIESVHLTASIVMNYRLYYMISMVVQYAQINNKSAKMILLVPNYPEKWAERVLPNRNQQKDLERLKTIFQPAIRNGFLEIKEINFSAQECLEIEKEICSKNKSE